MSDLKLYLAQINQFWEDKEANKRHIEDLLVKENLEKDSILILPEMFNTSFTTNPEDNYEIWENSESLKWVIAQSSKYEIAFITSMIIKEGEKFYNRLVFVDRNEIIGHYDKNYLFSLAGEDQHFTSGNERLVFQYKGWKILPLICYDLRFPEHARVRDDSEYDLLLYVANWPQKRIEHWNKLLQARAIENLTYCVGVNRVGTDGNDFEYNGQSKVVDPMGNVIMNFEEGKEQIKSISIEKGHLVSVRERFGFLKDIR